MKMKNVLEWLEKTVKECPDKTAFLDTDDKITFAKVSEIAKKEGAYLIRKLGIGREPVAVFAGRKMITPAYFHRSLLLLIIRLSIITIMMVVVMLSRIADIKNEMKAITHISFRLFRALMRRVM